MGSFDYGGEPPRSIAEHGVLQVELHWGRLIAHFSPSGVHRVWSPALALPGLHGDASVQEESSLQADIEARMISSLEDMNIFYFVRNGSYVKYSVPWTRVMYPSRYPWIRTVYKPCGTGATGPRNIAVRIPDGEESSTKRASRAVEWEKGVSTRGRFQDDHQGWFANLVGCSVWSQSWNRQAYNHQESAPGF